uniref:Uncharacterized protein n=1 Tax=Rhizophora mucronata TaxID=61149 RepID=A0A2P2IIK3_RHIMU
MWNAFTIFTSRIERNRASRGLARVELK